MPNRQKLCPGCQLPAVKKKHWWGRVGVQCTGPQPFEGAQVEWSASPILDSSRPAMNTRLRRNLVQQDTSASAHQADNVSVISEDEGENNPQIPASLVHERQRLEEENEQLKLELLRQNNAKLRRDIQQAQDPLHFPEDLAGPLAGLHVGHGMRSGHVGTASNQPMRQQSSGKEPLYIIDYVDRETVADDGTKRDSKTLASVSIPEWNVANIRILYALIESNDLFREEPIGEGGTLDAYMAYTEKIMEYACQFPWKNVLKYDQAFRHKQANGHLSWDEDNQHLVTVHLVSPLHQPKASPRQKGNTGQRPTGKPICRMYNQQGGCTWFGPGGCSYIHKCSVPGCAQQHPAHMHDAHVGAQNRGPQPLYNNAKRD